MLLFEITDASSDDEIGDLYSVFLELSKTSLTLSQELSEAIILTKRGRRTDRTKAITKIGVIQRQLKTVTKSLEKLRSAIDIQNK